MTRQERENMTNIIIVKCDDKISEVRRFTSVKHMNIFMSAKKLVFRTLMNKDKEEVFDKRYMIDANNNKAYKVFMYRNDKHYDDKSYKKNKEALQSFFDDYDEVHIKKRT